MPRIHRRKPEKKDEVGTRGRKGIFTRRLILPNLVKRVMIGVELPLRHVAAISLMLRRWKSPAP